MKITASELLTKEQFLDIINTSDKGKKILTDSTLNKLFSKIEHFGEVSQGTRARLIKLDVRTVQG